MPESTALGDELRQIREIRKLTLRGIGKLTGISNAYISQLEMGKIKKPSPNYLYKLAEAYSVPYDALMEKAGYIVYNEQEAPQKRSFLSDIGDLTEEEEAELMNYLAYIRSKKKRRQEG